MNGLVSTIIGIILSGLICNYLLNFLNNSGRNKPNGINRKIFSAVSTGPVIIPIKGVQEILGRKRIEFV